VLVGVTAQALLDLKPTPLSRVYPGVEIHATALDNLLSGDFLRDVSGECALLAIIGFALVCGVLGRMSSSGWRSASLFVVLLPLPFLGGLLAYMDGYWLPVAGPAVGGLLSLLAALSVNYAVEGRQKRFIKGAFSQYLSPEVIERIVQDPAKLKLGGETRELTILFSDIQGFTGISEMLTPEQLTTLLNQYLTAMTDIVMEEGGTVDKYEGDAIIAFWNAPLDVDDHAARAVRAALRCQRRLAEMRPDFKTLCGRDLHARFGVNTGKVVVGNMGSNQRFNYTFLGDAGNLASRLEGVNKEFGTYLMISEYTKTLLGDEFVCRELARVKVVGRAASVRVFEPMLRADYDARRNVMDTFASGLAAYYEGRFLEAGKFFETFASQDPPCRIFLARCRAFEQSPPSTWDGVWEMRDK
jgi:adenylate cyclase